MAQRGCECNEKSMRTHRAGFEDDEQNRQEYHGDEYAGQEVVVVQEIQWFKNSLAIKLEANHGRGQKWTCIPLVRNTLHQVFDIAGCEILLNDDKNMHCGPYLLKLLMGNAFRELAARMNKLYF